MKTTKILVTVTLGIICSANAFAQNSEATKEKVTAVQEQERDHLKTETFKVYGNCGMCEKTIEGALKSVKGIEKADWNKETKMMEVTFDEKLVSLIEIKQKIADVGYDTDEVRASDKAYSKLPGCCQYERPESKQEEHHHNHKH